MADEASNNKKKIVVIDGNSLMHRAFHAVPPHMQAPDGRSTNAIFGFFSMFVKMCEIFNPDGVICAFDKGRPAVRMEMLPQYKAQRPPMDPNLHEQFPMIKEILRTMEIPVVEKEGWEGDDILGTLARLGSGEGYDMYLITGDRDMYQLTTDDIKIVATHKGMSDISIMTPESVEKIYHGITPELVPDFYGLKGDTSDNIPGVPGIGPKRASDLINKYGNLDEVIAHADEVKGKMGENLRAHVDDALLSRKVAIIRTDAPIEIDFKDAAWPSFDGNNVVAALTSLGFGGMAYKVAGLAEGGFVSNVKELDIPEAITGTKASDLLKKAIDKDEWLGVSYLNLNDADAQISFFAEEKLFVATSDGLLEFDSDVESTLVILFKDAKIASLDVKELIHVVCPMDSSVPSSYPVEDMDASRLFDLSVASYLLDSSDNKYDPSTLVSKFSNFRLKELGKGDDLGLAKQSAFVALELLDTLKTKLEEDGSDKCFYDIEMPLLCVLCHMEREGMFVDRAMLKEQSDSLGLELDSITSKLYELAGEEFNIDSPMQLSHILFDVLELPTTGLKKTKSGYYSTNAKVLDNLAQEYEIVADVLDYREKNKIKSTYLDSLPKELDKYSDERIHSTFNQTIAATGRLSSSDPNLQNIPVRSELGRKVRTAFTVPEDSVFLACDYSQIELRLLAHLSGDKGLVDAFCQGADFHAATAARVFGCGVDEVTPELRSKAKAVNFGIVYGQQAFGLAQQLHISRREAQGMIDKYFEAYPGVRTYLDETVKFAERQSWVSTIYGRKRHVPDINNKNFAARSFAERTAMNHPMQGTAADIIKIAMIEVQRKLKENNMKSKLILQIHDELDFEVPMSELDDLTNLVRDTMENVVELKVPLVADVSWGKTWAEAK